MFFQHIQRRTKTWLLLGVCLLVLSSIPGSALADVTISQSVDNTLTEFTRGKFQRTSLGLLQDPASSPKLADQPGAVQLGPIGILKNWEGEAGSEMPRKLLRMGATAIGSRIYVVGGQTTTTSGSETIANVISAPINPTNGNIIAPEIGQSAWREEPALPAVQGSVQTGFTDVIAPINSAAVTSYAKTGGGGGYIYVIGGNTRIGTKDFSSFAVRVATVDGNGSITSWKELPQAAQIPDREGKVNTIFQHGLQSSSAVMFTIGGKTFVYLVGGLQRYFEGIGTAAKTINEGSSSVFYAQVNPSNGGLYKPSSNLGTEGWEQLSNVPVSRETKRTDAGMWDATAFADNYVLAPGTPDSNGLFIMGGQIAPDTGSGNALYTAATYVGLIQDDGKLFWSDWSGTLPAARFGHAGVTFRGNLYVTGGIPSSGSNFEPDKQMLASYVEDSLELPEFGTSNFLENAVLPKPRAFHATVLVQAGNGSESNAYVYVIGGRGDTRDADSTDDQGSESVFFSSIGKDEDKTFGYPLTGWYYSGVFPINFANAELREINWATQMIDPAMDIEVDYRISTANACDAPGFSDEVGTPTGWKLLAGKEATAPKRSAAGINTFPIENLPARCFQYRARLISPSAGNAQAAAETPSLLNVAIEIIIPGSPDLKVDTLKVVPGKTNPAAFGGLDAIITNKNAIEDTVAANAEKSGSFFVDLLVFEPGETVNVPTLPLSGADMARSRAFANVSRDKLTPNALFRITNWCDQAAVSGCVPLDQAKLITKVGKYTFIVVVDSTGCADKDATTGVEYVCVRETSKGPDGQNVGEINNTLAVTYDAPPNPANPSEPLPPEIVVLPPLEPEPGAVCTGGQPFCLSLPLISK